MPQVLYTQHNVLSGTFPSELPNARDLRYLRLEHNQISGALPPTLGNATHLQTFHAHHNRLGGSLPAQERPYCRATLLHGYMAT